jgi:hypothetical protein
MPVNPAAGSKKSNPRQAGGAGGQGPGPFALFALFAFILACFDTQRPAAGNFRQMCLRARNDGFVF